MESLSRLIYIKDLMILQSPIVFKMIKPYVEDAANHGVYIGELAMNPYIYETRSLDISFLVKYIESLDNVSKLFRKLYNEYIYDLRLQGLLNNPVNPMDFHMIFNAVNNTFNKFLDDQFLFEDFGIYQSQTSLETSMALYDTFNDYFIYSMIGVISPTKLKFFIHNKNIKCLPEIYDKIFEQFEYIYLPFY